MQVSEGICEGPSSFPFPQRNRGGMDEGREQEKSRDGKLWSEYKIYEKFN